jgi:hypothetical protein
MLFMIMHTVLVFTFIYWTYNFIVAEIILQQSEVFFLELIGVKRVKCGIEIYRKHNPQILCEVSFIMNSYKLEDGVKSSYA